ncbi:MAG: transketolase [Deltaproteobacteria bacterium]|nr:transketolase [Deltaproteobacteria bacterium]MDQ3299559.1 transketolase [Myxococcota bacterium]
MTTDLPTLAINTIRTLAIDAIQQANSGHPGLPLGCAPMAYTLWHKHLKHDPSAPLWFDRDRFVLSAGHGSMLLYALLHLTGYELSLDEIKQFRQWDSKTPGHPEWHHTPGVEATTGPLGQGAANAVGMAIAERFLASQFNRPGHTIIDHHTYALVSDGDVMEGVACEAVSIAGHLGLGKLTYLYDANDITLDGPLSLTMSEDVGARFAACGWHVQHVGNGDTDLASLDAAIAAARAETDRPSLIVIKTTIGYGSPKKAGTSSAHGSPLGDAEVAATKQALGWDPAAKFLVPPEVKQHLAEGGKRGASAHAAWKQKLAAYKAAHPDVAAQLELAIKGELPAEWDAEIPKFTDAIATRSASGKIMQALANKIPWLFGGDADLGGSTKTIVKGGDYDRVGAGRNLRFGIREHAMGSIGNGMLYHGGVRPFVATFFVFSDYMRPAVRLAALNNQPAIFVWTHDSVGLGEDGPTHQPVEHLMALRAIPNLAVFRPADAHETAAGWRFAMTHKGPTGLVLSRQDLPIVTAPNAPGAERGAYVLADGTDVILIASGSEVAVALAARDALAKDSITARVVSMPCWELFAQQPASYREQVLPYAQRRRVSVEAGVTLGWREYIGDRGEAIGIDRFGASAPGELVLEKLGINTDAVVAAAKRVIASA